MIRRSTKRQPMMNENVHCYEPSVLLAPSPSVFSVFSLSFFSFRAASASSAFTSRARFSNRREGGGGGGGERESERED